MNIYISDLDDPKNSPSQDKTLTRREKKIKNRLYVRASRFKDKQIVPEKDKLNIYKRKAKAKYKKSVIKFSRETKSFDKSEGIFNQWLKENIHRFNIKPIKNSENTYFFDGVIKNVSLYLNWTPEAIFSFYSFVPNIYGDTYFDQMPIDYIGYEKYSPQKGFYDADRTDGIYDYFPTRKELYINVFESIIEYCNEFITSKHSLYLFDFHGMTSAFIELTDENSEIVKKRVVGDGFIEDLSKEECEKLLLEKKAYKTIKYDLFDTDKAPLIRYTRIKS